MFADLHMAPLYNSPNSYYHCWCPPPQMMVGVLGSTPGQRISSAAGMPSGWTDGLCSSEAHGNHCAGPFGQYGCDPPRALFESALAQVLYHTLMTVLYHTLMTVADAAESAAAARATLAPRG